MKFAFMALKFNLGVVLNILIYSIKKKKIYQDLKRQFCTNNSVPS